MRILKICCGIMDVVRKYLKRSWKSGFTAHCAAEKELCTTCNIASDLKLKADNSI